MKDLGPVDILLVDDNPAKLLALEVALAPLNQNLVMASSGREALQRLLLNDFAVVILDVNMPDIDGFETARMIRSRQRSAHTPIVFVSAVNQDHADALQGYALGAVDYIFAPIIPEVLRAKVAVFVELHRKTEEARSHAERLRERTEELERSQRELQLAERMATIGTLCAGIGHDMGNLLLPVSIWVDSIDDNDFSPSTREGFDSIRTCVSYLRRLSGGLRQLALDPDSEFGEPSTCLASWMEETEPILRNALPRGMRLDFEPIPAMPPMRIARHQLTQIVFNLVQNAGEAMRARGHGRVRIAAERRDDDRRVRLRVSDDGPGMDPGVASRCFDPFFTTKPRSISTGLGLALVSGIVQRTGGAISVASSDNGTVFQVDIPLVDIATEKLLAVVSLAEPRIRGYATGILRLAGFEIHQILPEGHSGPAVWITDDLDAMPTAAPAFLNDRDDRRILVYADEHDRTASTPGVSSFSLEPGRGSLRDHIREYMGRRDAPQVSESVP